MQAVILVGGTGTRLRPLTLERPKPIVPIVDRPFLAHALQWVARHGMTDVVLCCGFKSDAVVEALGDGSQYGVSITWVFEPEPRGTAGALKMAEPHLDERFVMLNGDVLTDMDLSAQVAAHERTGAVATLGLIPVEDPSAYGLVRRDEAGAVVGFLEKPSPDELVPGEPTNVSAGAYVLERRIVDMIAPDVEVSIEREVWPQLVGNGLYGFAHREDSYWMDIGTRERYVQAVGDVLAGRVQTAVAQRMAEGSVHPGARVEATASVARHALVEDNAVVAADAIVGAGTVVGDGASVGEGAILRRSVLLPGATIGPGARVTDSVIGAGAVVVGGASVSQAIVGDRSTVGAAAADGVEVA